MNDCFKNMFSDIPMTIENDIYLFDSDADGDPFDETDREIWYSGSFQNRLKETHYLENDSSRYLIESIVKQGDPIVDVACGPGMGLIPSIKQLNPNHLCLATDANSLVIKEWRKYLDNNDIEINNLDFAQFSLMDIPFKDNSVPAYSSNIGVGSTRSGEIGKERALKEIYRTLVPNGLFYTIEVEWEDVEIIKKVFQKMQWEVWDIFKQPQKTWHERFIEQNFEIIYEKDYTYRKITAKDNELGEAAEQLGIDIGIKEKAYILRKK